jgi:heme/copper-type cytochrome/quinol oxidase subunit 4
MIYASLHLVVFLYMEEDNADETENCIYGSHNI